MTGRKRIVCADALEWLPRNPGGAIVTSPPDAEEIGADLREWRRWFDDALDACLAACAVAVFYVTDRKVDGGIETKAGMVHAAAIRAGLRPAWHKIALRRDPGKIDIHRPGFSHLIALGGRSGAATPDVIYRGQTLYPNGTGLVAARVAVEWAGKHSRRIVDPFCGVGTIPAVAAALGYDAIGVDLDPGQCARAEALRLSLRT